MTLGDFFIWISNHPIGVLTFFIGLPITALLAGIMGKDEGAEKPWKYLYSTLIYLAAIPGIFAVTLNVYLFLFEKQSIMSANLYTQVLPILFMFLTFFIVRRNVEFCDIPGFDKISGLVMAILAIICFMWILEKTHIFVISIMPFYYVIFIFIALLLFIRIGVSRFFQ